MFYVGHKKINYIACQLIETEAMMFGHDGELRVKVWALDVKGKKTLAYFSVDRLELGTNTVKQFYGCHWHGHT